MQYIERQDFDGSWTQKRVNIYHGLNYSNWITDGENISMMTGRFLNTGLFTEPPSGHKGISFSFFSSMNRNGKENYYLKVQPKCNLYNKMEIQACLPVLGIQSRYAHSKVLKPHKPTTIQNFFFSCLLFELIYRFTNNMLRKITYHHFLIAAKLSICFPFLIVVGLLGWAPRAIYTWGEYENWNDVQFP